MTGVDEQERILSRLRAAHRVAGIGSWEATLDAGGRATFEWSPEVGDIVGWVAERPPTYGDFVSVIHPDDRPGFFEARDAALRGTRPYRVDLRLVRPDGQIRHVHLAAEVIRSEDGTPERLVGVVQDRTEELESIRRTRAAEASRRHLLQRLLEASDHERERVARHLEIAAVEALRGVEARMAAEIGPDAPEAWREALDGVRRSVTSLTGALSAISSTPAGADLEAVVADIVADASDELDVRADVQVEVPPRPELRAVVVRLVQEGLQNTRKHAGATAADVRIRADADAVHVVVADDGCGFDADVVHRARDHFGIASLRDDVAAVGGELAIRTGPAGTTLDARLPLR
ncbi:MAG TPA: PAS domain-containing protein [Acidimicrobiales bacterium]|nr:PAS domain-containing protein [Acidimicrobiales bacterium]